MIFQGINGHEEGFSYVSLRRYDFELNSPRSMYLPIVRTPNFTFAQNTDTYLVLYTFIFLLVYSRQGSREPLTEFQQEFPEFNPFLISP